MCVIGFLGAIYCLLRCIFPVAILASLPAATVACGALPAAVPLAMIDEVVRCHGDACAHVLSSSCSEPNDLSEYEESY